MVANALAAAPKLPIDKIHPSNTNRHIADPAKDAELLESVRKDGVLQAISLRPHPTEPTGHYEIIYGERRWRAAKKAGLTEIPAFVRNDLSDADVTRLQLVENLERADLHPLDEADGYRALQEKHNLTVAQIADEVGKKPSLIKQRLALCTLAPGARKLFEEGKLKLAVAQLIASAIRTPALQETAAKELSTIDDWTKEPMGYRRALEAVTRRYMLRLADAPFKTGDATLVPAAGACASCPKRTGNQRDLFEDVKADDLCTDQACFLSKKAATWAREAKIANEKNLRILSEKEAKKVFDQYRPDTVASSSGYIDPEAKTADYGKAQSWRALLGKSAPPPAIVQDPSGRPRQLYAKQDVAKALKAIGKKPVEPKASTGYERSDREKADDARKRRDESFHKQGIRGAMAIIADQAALLAPADEFWRILAEAMLHGSWHDVVKEVVKRRSWDEKKARPEDIVRRKMKDMEPAALRSLTIELAVSRGGAEPFRMACKLYGADPKKLEKDARAAAATDKKPAKKKGK